MLFLFKKKSPVIRPVEKDQSKKVYAKHLFFCVNERKNGIACCQNHNAIDMYHYAKKKMKGCVGLGLNRVRVNSSSCLGRCNVGPLLVVYPDCSWYTYKTKEDIDEIIEKHILKNEVVTRLLLE